MSAAGLNISRVTVRGGGCTIIRDISLAACPGELVALVGRNGSGKTTLLRACAGLLPGGQSVAGVVEVDGAPLAQLTRREIARRIASLPQLNDTIAGVPAGAFIELGRYPHLSRSGPGAEDRAAVTRAIELTGTGKLLERDMATLSGGERQRVLLAGALAQAPAVLLLDEPTTFLDPAQRQAMWEIIRGVAEAGTAVLAASHDVGAVGGLAHRVIGLAAGEKIFEGSGAAFTGREVLEQIYGCAPGWLKGLPT